VSINSAYKKVISSLINCFLSGEFDARHLASEINAVPLPEAKNEQDREELEKYYDWLTKELETERVVRSS